MASTASVRPAERGDVPGIQRVARAAWHEAYDDCFGEAAVAAMVDEAYDEDVLERMIGLDEVGLFVAAHDGEVVGYASCGMTEPASIGDLDIYVHPDHWGEGIGTALLERGEQHLREVGTMTIRDEVLVENEVGNAFYRRHFEEAGQRTVDFGGEEKTVAVYEKSL
ncbi:GNAT family N-acetyltransferase [Halomicrobium salinisoli]|uniref:GNAT family N-acetyltransferase n=1 Tax=Halomicrobium salinisoli TaxID=2878391 RepID=UPI001CEFE2FF|nr:GNAT family N-acetyltransferase [Halomicrobium salinisoli]